MYEDPLLQTWNQPRTNRNGLDLASSMVELQYGGELQHEGVRWQPAQRHWMGNRAVAHRLSRNSTLESGNSLAHETMEEPMGKGEATAEGAF